MTATEHEQSGLDCTDDRTDEWSLIEAEPVDLDPDRVNRTLKALAYKQRDLDEYDTAAEGERREQAERHAAERAELEDRITRGRSPLVESVAVLERKLQMVGHARLAADPGASTWKLPAGRIEIGGGGIEKEWGDEEALREWAKEHAPEALEPQPDKLNKNKLWEALKAHAVREEHKRQAPAREDGTVVIDGEVVPGITVKAKDRTVTPAPIKDAV